MDRQIVVATARIERFLNNGIIESNPFPQCSQSNLDRGRAYRDLGLILGEGMQQASSSPNKSCILWLRGPGSSRFRGTREGRGGKRVGGEDGQCGQMRAQGMGIGST